MSDRWFYLLPVAAMVLGVIGGIITFVNWIDCSQTGGVFIVNYGFFSCLEPSAIR